MRQAIGIRPGGTWLLWGSPRPAQTGIPKDAHAICHSSGVEQQMQTDQTPRLPPVDATSFR